MVVKNGLRLCGTGSARGSAPILQDKAYWEVKVQQNVLSVKSPTQVKVQQGGRWSAGIATPAADLTKDLGLDHCRLLLIQLIQTLSHFFETSTALFFFLLSWAVTSEGVVRSRGQQEYRVSGLEVTFAFGSTCYDTPVQSNGL